MLRRAGRLLPAGNAVKTWDLYKGRKLSIDAAGLLSYAVKRNSGEPLSTPTPVSMSEHLSSARQADHWYR
jgi:hypothetical protein